MEFFNDHPYILCIHILYNSELVKLVNLHVSSPSGFKVISSDIALLHGCNDGCKTIYAVVHHNSHILHSTMCIARVADYELYKYKPASLD